MKYILAFFLIMAGLAQAGVMISEVMPNPIGKDDDIMPNGEWVELYNNGTNPYILNDCFLSDSGGNKLVISGLIDPKSYFMVYRNGDKGFSLNNDGDEVILTCKDAISKMKYKKSKEGKSIALTKNGWRSGEPTPNKENLKSKLKNQTSSQPLGYEEIKNYTKGNYSNTPLGSSEKIINIDDKTKVEVFESTSYKRRHAGIYIFCMTSLIAAIAVVKEWQKSKK